MRAIWMSGFLSLLAACGAAKAPAAGAPPTAAAAQAAPAADAPAYAFGPQDLVGTWVGPCFPSPQGDGSHNQLTFRMTATTWDLDYTAYGDAACGTKFLTVHIQGDYTLGGTSSVEAGAREGTFGFRTKTVTPHLDGAVGVINGACGVTTAKVGEALDIGGGCAGLGAYPIAACAADSDIVRLQDKVLSFGARPADNNMCTPDKRPTTFTGGAQVTRQ